MPNILSRAELLLQAKNYSGTGAWLDESGNSHDAQLGSTAGVDANDPEFLAHSGDNYVRLPGSAGNYVSSADVNLLDANQAHNEQAVGWVVRGQAADVQTVANSDATIGDNVGQWRAATSATTSVRTSVPGTGVGIALSPSTQYALTIRLRAASGTLRNANVYIEEYNDTSYVGVSAGTAQDLPADGSWVEFSATHTTAASGSDNLVVYVSVTSAGANELFQFDAACLMEGASASFVPSLRIVGDLDMRAKLAADDWDSGNQYLFDAGDATTKGYLWLLSSGSALFYWDGNNESSTYTSSLTDGTTYELRVTRDASTGNVIWYLDGAQADTDTSTPSAITVGGGALAIGATQSGSNPLDGNLYWAEVRDGIDGPVVARYDADDAAEPFATQTGSVDGRTWTYNRSGSGLYVVDRPAFGLYTDDYFVVADHANLDFANGEDATLIAVARTNDLATLQRMVDKRGGASLGYSIYVNGAGNDLAGLWGDGSNLATVTTTGINPSVRVGYVFASRRDDTTPLHTIFQDGTSAGTSSTNVGDASTAFPFTIGAKSYSTKIEFFDGEIMAVALFREALTDAEIAAVSNALAGLAPGTGEYTDQDALGAIRNRLLYEGTYTEATAPRGIVGALNAFLGTSAGDVEGALNEKIGSGYVGIVQACNTLLAGSATVYEENDGLRKLAELYVP